MKLNCFFGFVFIVTNGLYSQIGKASDFGFDSINSTKALSCAITSKFDTIIIDKQQTSWKIEPLHFNNLSNKVILFEKGCEIIALPGKFPNETDALITLDNAQNLELLGNNATLKMNKSEYVTGEWRHILNLRKCRNIKIKGLNFIDSGGDGIYIAGLEKGSYSEQIEIEEIICRNNKRQGISIISAQNVKVKNCIFSETKGTNPEAGLDIEPNSSEDRLVNILFENCVFSENNHAGIKISLHKLKSNSMPVSITFKNSLIENNHDPDNNQTPAEISIDGNTLDPVGGEVVFDNCLIRNSRWGVLYSRKRSDAFKVTFKNCAAERICSSGQMPPFFLEVPDYFRISGALGGFDFGDFFISYSASLPAIRVRGSKLRTLRFESVKGNFIINNLNKESNYLEYIQHNPRINKNINIKFISKAVEKEKE